MGGGGGPFVPRSKDEMAHIPWFVDWSLSFTAGVYAAQASNPSLALKIDLPFTRASPALDSWLLRAVARRASRGKAELSDRGAGFTLLYLDDDLRMHRTFDGQYFVQQRISSAGPK